MPKEARTTVSLLLKSMAADGMVERYEYKIGRRQFITYKRLMPLRKRERIARFLGV
jgi:predicted transcriptional regulator